MSIDPGPMRSVNPATEVEIETFTPMGARTIDDALATSARAQRDWGGRAVRERAGVLARTAAALRRECEHHASTITREMGKPLSEAREEVEKCARVCEYYAEYGPALLADEPAPSDSGLSYIAFRPLGLVLTIMPWNFPFWQAFRCAAPTLLAGNAVLLKHAANVTRCALDIEALFLSAGLPPGAFRTLVIPPAGLERVIAAPAVRAVSLTGSDRAGRAVAARAGGHLKKTVLELGGSDAFIVLADADLQAAAATAIRSRFQNAGQSCIAAKRFIVIDAVAADFEERLVAGAERIEVGDPTADGTEMGPLARADLRERLEEQIAASLGAGASLLTGGRRVGGMGYFHEPTVLGHCQPGMAVFDEETFGPVAAIMRVTNAEDAISVANSSRYGLGASVWTRDIERGLGVVRRLETGGAFINGLTHSDPRIPFGGVKDSGYGRELHTLGLREFVNPQTVWIEDRPGRSS